TDPAPTAIYTLSLHDALPISPSRSIISGPRLTGPPGPYDGRISGPAPGWPWTRHASYGETCPTPLRLRGSFRVRVPADPGPARRSEEHTSELQSRRDLVCRLL